MKALVAIAFLVLGSLAQTTSPTCAVATATPSPKATICGQQGRVKLPPSGGTVSPEATSDDCRRLCLANSNCVSYGYNKTDTICTQYVTNLKKQQWVPGKTNTYFWNKSCWKETCHCDTTAKSEAPNLCGHLCVNKQYDRNNCGKCGIKCPTSQDCIAGQCMPPPDKCTKTMPSCTADKKQYVCGPGIDRGGEPCMCVDSEGKNDSGYCLSDFFYGRFCRFSYDCSGDEFCSYNSCFGKPVCIKRLFDCNNPMSASRIFRG